MTILFIGLGGFAGAISRYVLDGWVSSATRGVFPWGTLAINASGSFLIGILYAVMTEGDLMPAELRGPLMIGFIGAYTTFSTLMLETWRLADDGAWLLAGGNLAGSMVLGIGAVLAGLAVGRAV